MKNDRKEEKISEYEYEDLNDLYDSLSIRQFCFEQFKLFHPNSEFAYLVLMKVNENKFILKIKISVNVNSF